MILSEKLPGRTMRNSDTGMHPEGKYHYMDIEPEVEEEIDDENDVNNDVDDGHDPYEDYKWDTEWDDPDENGIASLRAAHPELFDDEGVKDAIMQIAHCDEETAYEILNWAEATNNPKSNEFEAIKDNTERAEAILAAYNEEDPDYDDEYIQMIEPDEALEEDDGPYYN